MATNTAVNIGIRLNCGTLGERNFENVGTVQYKCNHQGMEFLGTAYNVGDTFPFDGGASPHTSYSATALRALELAWNQGWILPLA